MRCGSCGVALLVPGGRQASTVVSQPPRKPSAKLDAEVEAIDDLEATESVEDLRAAKAERRLFQAQDSRATPIEPERVMPPWAWSVLAGVSTLTVAIVVSALLFSSRPSKQNDPNRAGDDPPVREEKNSAALKPAEDSIVGDAPPDLPSTPKSPDRSLENDPDALARAISSYYKENARWVDECAAILVNHYRFDRVFRVTIDGLDKDEDAMRYSKGFAPVSKR